MLSKLPSLQSMTQRLRSHSQRVLQPMTQQHLGRPATVDEAEEVQKSHASMQHDTDAHVVVFVHGFRVTITIQSIFNQNRFESDRLLTHVVLTNLNLVAVHAG